MRLLIGLGGNLGDVAAALAAAADGLARRCRIAGRSSVWQTAPVGPPQPEYLNAALLVDTEVDPLRLLACTQRLEVEAGRDRAAEVRLGPRPLDVDLLVALELVVEGPALTLPHPFLAARRFALLPACELAPAWVHPRLHRTLGELLASLDPAGQRCERRGPFPT